MSDTNVQTIDQQTIGDLFPEIGKLGTASGAQKPGTSFGMDPAQSADMFPNTSASTTPTTTDKPSESTTDTTTPAPVGEGTKEPDKNEADILGGKPVVTHTPLNDLSAYYADRMKSGLFTAVKTKDDKGNDIDFIPTTAEEYDEVLQLQIDDKVAKSLKEREASWFASKSPAWKAITQYADLVDDPTQLIPFLQGVKVLQSVANLDETNVDGAEQIIRTRLEQRGDPEEVIASQIEALKTTDKLVSTAKQYKPIILQQEQQSLALKMKTEQQQQLQYQNMVDEIRDSALKAIELPIFGKTKLKQEEKAAIYELIAEPSEESQGYGIYNAIDQLFDKRDFDTLKQVALLLAKKDSFYTYLGTSVANQTAASLERKLRLAGDARSTSGNDYDEDVTRNTVQRNQFKTKPSFGRS